MKNVHPSHDSIQYFYKLNWKTKIKKKEAGNGPIAKN